MYMLKLLLSVLGVLYKYSVFGVNKESLRVFVYLHIRVRKKGVRARLINPSVRLQYESARGVHALPNKI